MRNLEMLAALLVAFLGVQSLGKNVGKGTASVETNPETLDRQAEANNKMNEPTFQIQKSNEDLIIHGPLLRKEGEPFVLKMTWCFWLGCANAHYYKPCCKLWQPYCRGLICKRKQKPCYPGWALVGSGCYRVVNVATFEQARAFCEDDRGSLVEITSQIEQDTLGKFYEDSLINGWVWLGAQKTQEDEWRWISSEEKMIFNSWGSGEPNNAEGEENCLVWDGNESWKAVRCDVTDTNFKAICEEHKEPLPQTTDGTESVTVAPSPKPPKRCYCGIPNRTLRIVGGKKAEKHEYPWQVALVYGDDNIPFCSGSLISRETVLTAAHCTEGLEATDISVLVGEHNVTDKSDGQRKNKVKQIIQNNLYNFVTIDYDISLLILMKPIKWSKKAKPICLPNQSSNYENVMGIVSGWGNLEYNGLNSDILLETEVMTMTNKECTTNKQYNTSEITSSMICAAGDGRDACHGDSGGPLVSLEAAGYYSVIGVVSWGKGCADQDSPGVYSRVVHQMLWIKDNMVGQTCLLPEANWKPKVTALEESVKSMEADIQAIREMVTSLAAKHGGCLADITSPDCPPPAGGKTSVAEGISANTAALADKCDASTCSDIQEAISELQKNVNIVVTGGYFDGKNLETSEIISPGGVCSQGIPPLPVAVRHHQSVYFNNSLMVCGGYGDNSNQKRCHQLRNSNSQWTEGPAMNIDRHHFSMTKAGQDLYALGGWRPGAIYTDSMEKLSGSSGEWTLMDQKLTSARAHHCTVFMKTTNSLVTMGGSSSTILNVVEEFNLATLTWKQLASLPMSLFQPACVALDQTIVAIGGHGYGGGGVQKKVYQFSGGNWQTTGELEIARHYHTAGIINNKLIVIGGAEDPDGIEEIEDDGNFKKLQKTLSKKISYHASTEVPRNDFTCS